MIEAGWSFDDDVGMQRATEFKADRKINGSRRTNNLRSDDEVFVSSAVLRLTPQEYLVPMILIETGQLRPNQCER